MKVFDFDPARYRETYRDQQWLHVPGGVAPWFLDHLRGVGAEAAAARQQMAHAGHRGEKDQYLYDPPFIADVVAQLFEMVGSACGLDPAKLTLSERHVNCYELDADPSPAPHKDRLASQVTVGISVDIPERSCLVLYPRDDRSVNRFMLSSELRASLDPDELPEAILDPARAVEIHDRPGDVVAFAGSSMWHLRRNAAGAVNLYLKCNDFECDPLAEDLGTDRRWRSTSSVLQSDDTRSLDDAIPVVSRQFEWTGELTGHAGEPRWYFKLWGGPPFPISTTDRSVIRSFDGTSSWEILRKELGDERSVLDERLRRLARRGAVDLLAAGAPQRS